MSPDGSRRALLRGAGLAALGGLAGCLWGPVEEEGPAGGGRGTTPPPGRTYSFEVRNEITSDDLAAMPHVGKSAETELTIEATRSVRGEEDPVLFETTLGLAPESSRTISDAFTTEADGDTYVVTAEITPFVEHERRPRGLRNEYRFTPGEFNTPSDDVFTVIVTDEDEGKDLSPFVEFE